MHRHRRFSATAADASLPPLLQCHCSASATASVSTAQLRLPHLENNLSQCRLLQKLSRNFCHASVVSHLSSLFCLSMSDSGLPCDAGMSEVGAPDPVEPSQVGPPVPVAAPEVGAAAPVAAAQKKRAGRPKGTGKSDTLTKKAKTLFNASRGLLGMKGSNLLFVYNTEIPFRIKIDSTEPIHTNPRNSLNNSLPKYPEGTKLDLYGMPDKPEIPYMQDFLEWAAYPMHTRDFFKMIGLGNQSFPEESPLLWDKFSKPGFDGTIDFRDEEVFEELVRLSELPFEYDEVAVHQMDDNNEMKAYDPEDMTEDPTLYLSHTNVLLSHNVQRTKGNEYMNNFLVEDETLLKATASPLYRKILLKNFRVVVDGHGKKMWWRQANSGGELRITK
jgi:hypothetical protein